MKSKVASLLRPWKSMGLIGGFGVAVVALAPVFFGVAFDIQWLMWTGIGLYGLLVICVLWTINE